MMSRTSRLLLILSLAVIVGAILRWGLPGGSECLREWHWRKGSQSPIMGNSPYDAVTGSDLLASVPTNDRVRKDINEFLEMTRNTAINADVREKFIMELGRRGGPDAIPKLMALGNEETYFNFAALKALANLPTPEVAAYLEAKCFHPDPRMVSAAVSSLAKVEGAAAVPKIADVLARNRIRDDGFQDLICAQCVNTLKELGVSSALPVLLLELEKTVGVSLQYEYGSTVVAAVGEIGDPAGLAALEAYAERLKALKARQPNREMGVQYFQSKIDEVEGVIKLLRSHQFPD